MTVAKRGNSKFWYVQFQLNGRTFIRSTKTTDKKLAERMEAEWRRQTLERQVLGIKERITLQDASRLYVEAKTGMASSVHLARICERICQGLGPSSWLDELRSPDIERLIGSLKASGYSAQTLKHHVNAVRGVWKNTKRLGYEVSDLELPSIKLGKGRLRYLTLDEERRLLLSLDPKRPVKGLRPYEQRSDQLKREMQDVYDFVVLLLDTGARYMELAMLRWRDVSMNEGTMSLWRPKVKNESILFMTERVRQIMHRRFTERSSEFVFSNRLGGHRTYLASTMKRAFKRAGLNDCTAHTLRHTHATRLIQNGLNLYEVKEMLGHSDIKTTMRYAHLEQRAISSKASSVMNLLARPDT